MESFCPRRARHPRNSAHCAGCISSSQFVSPHYAATSNGFGHGDMYSGHVGTHACDTTSAKEAPAVNRGTCWQRGKSGATPRMTSVLPNYYSTAMALSATGCRHPLPDASISTWMAVGICMEILSAQPRASNMGCGLVDNAAVQAERDHPIAAQLPNPP